MVRTYVAVCSSHLQVDSRSVDVDINDSGSYTGSAHLPITMHCSL